MNKNSFIELLRFLFASIILLFHAGSDAGILNNIYHLGGCEVSFFKYGYLSVEFFFIVSGYLMAKTAFSRGISDNGTVIDLAKETVDFLVKKIRSIATIYFISCALVSVYFLVIGKKLVFVIERLPSLLLLQCSGIVDKEFIGLSWYISSMIICMAIIYPLLRKQYSMFTNIYGPLLGILITGYLIHMTGYLGGVFDWIGFTYKCNLRAFADLSLGTTCFEAARKISIQKWGKKQKCLFSILAVFSSVTSVVSICSTQRIFNDGIILLSMCVLVTVLFGKVGLLSQINGLYSNRLFDFLGELSLPIFLLQNVFHYWVSYFYRGGVVAIKIALIYWGTIIFALVVVKCLKRMRLRNLP